LAWRRCRVKLLVQISPAKPATLHKAQSVYVLEKVQMIRISRSPGSILAYFMATDRGT
ncbi:6374_t:CDS:1, partial [Acaulospora colombiana]